MKLKLSIVVLFLSFSAFSWGRVGHETIACIAELNLNAETRARIKPLLAGETLESVANWADQIKNRRHATAPWHYIDLPVRENITAQDLPPIERDSRDVVSQLKLAMRTLKNSHGPLGERQEALKFLVHFAGDLAMPLHCADDNDRGGNEKKVRFFSPTSRSNKGHVTSLHSLWDNLIEVKAAEDPHELAESLDRKIGRAERREWAGGNPDQWALESYRIARDTIYADLPAGAAFAKLPRSYYEDMRPIVDRQLEKAGIRLARILEEVFGGGSRLARKGSSAEGG